MEFSGKQVLILGGGVTGNAVAKIIEELGASIKIADEKEVIGFQSFPIDVADNLEDLRSFDLAVVSPGWKPSHPLIKAVQAAGVELTNEIDIAWQLKKLHRPNQKWVAITGTNGKTSTTELAAAMISASGISASACGNVGTTVIESIFSETEFQVLVIELSSFQIHWMQDPEFVAGAILNIADDHTDWHGSFEAYTQAKVKLLNYVGIGILNGQDQHLFNSTAKWPGKKIFFSLDTPAPGDLGLVEELLVDRAFTKNPNEAGAICELTEIQPTVPHAVLNTLAAAAIARSVGADLDSIRSAIKNFKPGRHRIELVIESNGVKWINDSKATNPHAAQASLLATTSAIWIAGGMAKGASFQELINRCKDRIKSAILIGVDRDLIATELQKNGIEYFKVDASENQSVMEAAVNKAKELATEGDTVLMAPACASMDQFKNYSDRGDQFAEAVKKLA